METRRSELFEGHGGSQCTVSEILIATNAENALDDGKNSILAQVINGFRSDIRWGCSASNIKGLVRNTETTQPAISSENITSHIGVNGLERKFFSSADKIENTLSSAQTWDDPLQEAVDISQWH